MTTADRVREHDALYRARLEQIVPVREPLMLISQIQRSGGTLLSQLFDGHPECHAHPHELSIAYLNDARGTAFDLSSEAQAFELVNQPRMTKRLRSGYRKPATNPGDADADVFPFLFLGGLQRQIFAACFEEGAAGDRDVLDCFFTSFFNAWLDNQGLYSKPKRLVTAFAPRLAHKPAAVERIFAAYPDGFLVSIVREPRGWFASARLQKARYSDVEHAISRWRVSVDGALDARDRFGDRVVLVTYEDLVVHTERTMEGLAARLGISMSPSLLVPTFNGRPIRANSSFSVEGYGILRNRTEAYRDSLDAATLDRVDALAGDVYDRARAAAIS